MANKEALLERLNQIGISLSKTGDALALLALGSVGVELDRIDNYSDLDFFAIVKDGCRQKFLDDRRWLSDICSIAYEFQNSDHGHKTLYEDDIFCEYAVFEIGELKDIVFSEGRIVWQDDSFDSSILKPKVSESKKAAEFCLGEAITNLYVGLGRFHRGEKLAAYKFIQGYAVDRITELASYIEEEQPAYKDIFASERRFEIRFPKISESLPKFLQGYDNSVQSAREILDFLDTHFDVNSFIKKRILELCDI